EQLSQRGMSLCEEHGKTLRINLPHASNVPAEMPLAHEFRQHQLFEHRCMPRCKRLRRFEPRQEVRRNHYVSETQRRKQHFAEAPGIKNDPAVIESLKRWHRAPGVTIFAVVVVLKNQGARLSCPSEQLQSSRDAHCGSQRKLVSRRDVNQANSPRRKLLDHDPFLIHSSAMNGCAISLERPYCPRIARILHAHGISVIYDYPSRNAE